ncbi:hypothetical protein Q9295_03365 [Xinfangfangia sp. CPCC 101601]|uniref:Uncharacterized protein n=1 Tax=Pseudogemmobacter lacusdianii TaxID=3069608 RepID=A0ABU0VWV6_9RHOB|nr:hypothetical protein [Xinfangfangia sp. CPCC 101601]MDQ2065400.1 hypothetical protein [Xinfangfangia sp. CPCC 101601]
MSFIQELADDLARDVLDSQDELGDDRFYEQVGRVLLAASPTLQESFMTSIRIRLAERRGRDFLDKALKAKRDGSKAPDAPRDLSSGH